MRKKIIISLVSILLFFGFGATIAMLSIANITEELKFVIKLHQVEQLRRSLLINLQSVQSHLYTVHTPLAQDLDLIVENVLHLEKAAKVCSSCHHPEQLNNRISKVQSQIEDYTKHLSLYITSRANKERVKRLKVESAEIGNKIRLEIENMSHSASQKLENLTRSSMESITNITKTLLFTMGVSLFLSILVAFKLTISVTRPIKKLLIATNMISSGQLGATVSYHGKNEFGKLAKHFNTMSVSLKERNERLLENSATLQMQSEKLQQQSEELQKRVTELEEFYDMAIGRELKMKELKEKIFQLESYIDKLQSELSKYKK
jgi:HAMP domain-containing protein/cytochrome c553